MNYIYIYIYIYIYTVTLINMYTLVLHYYHKTTGMTHLKINKCLKTCGNYIKHLL